MNNVDMPRVKQNKLLHHLCLPLLLMMLALALTSCGEKTISVVSLDEQYSPFYMPEGSEMIISFQNDKVKSCKLTVSADDFDYNSYKDVKLTSNRFACSLSDHAIQKLNNRNILTLDTFNNINLSENQELVKENNTYTITSKYDNFISIDVYGFDNNGLLNKYEQEYKATGDNFSNVLKDYFFSIITYSNAKQKDNFIEFNFSKEAVEYYFSNKSEAMVRAMFGNDNYQVT